MADFAALPFFTDAYLADTGHLSDAEHGRYVRILILMWRSPECRVPNDDAWIARKLSRTCEEVVTQIRPLLNEFCQNDGNWITQKRLRKEHDYVRSMSEKQSDRAKLRWNKEKDICQGNATSGNAATGNAPTPTPTPTPTLPPKAPRKRGAEDTPEFLEFWEAYPHKVGKPAARRAFATALPKAPLQAILAGLERYKSQKPSDRSWCNPATFLNEERWNDQPATVTPLPFRTNGAPQKIDARTPVAATPHRQRIDSFRRTGFWPPLAGPKPGERNCDIPDDLLTDTEVAAKYGRESKPAEAPLARTNYG